MLEHMRKIAYYILDTLTGSQVLSALRELEYVDKLPFDSKELLNLQKGKLNSLLAHAADTVEFYRPYAGKPIADYPIIDKNTIKNNPDSFISNKYGRENLVVMHTGGSTGMPFTVYQDRKKKKRVNAECVYYSYPLGYDIGSPLVYFRVIIKQVAKSKLKQFIQNQPLVNCRDLSDEGIENMLHELAAFRSKKGIVVLAYASTYGAICDYFARKGTDAAEACRVRGIISGSEMMFDETRNAMEEAFRCKCVSRYSNQENGVLGQDVDQNNVFILNEADYFIEVLKFDEDRAAEEGETGRIVVTDFHNYGMPMIRYDTGDVGAIVKIRRNAVDKRAIGSFAGRRVDLITDVNGHRISPHAFVRFAFPYADLRQLQLIQTGIAKYCLKLNVSGRFSQDDEIIRGLQKILGDGASICIEHVSEIPVLASGKHKCVVNAMNCENA